MHICIELKKLWKQKHRFAWKQCDFVHPKQRSNAYFGFLSKLSLLLTKWATLSARMTLLWSCEAETTLKRLSELKSWGAQLQKKRLLDSQGTGWCSESESAASRCERMCLEEDWAMEGNIFDLAKDFSNSRNEDVHSDIGQSSCHNVKLILISILSRWKPAGAQSRSCLYWDSPVSRPSQSPLSKTGQHHDDLQRLTISPSSGCKSPASAN